MSPLGNRRRKKSRAYEVLIIPKGDGSGTKSFKANGTRLALWGSAAFCIFFLLFFLLFRYTPLGVLVGVDVTSEDLRRTEREETQRRIGALADEIAVLKDYNVQLRKALGEKTPKESAPPAEPVAKPAANEPPETAPVTVEEFSTEPLTTGTVTVAAGSGGLKASFPLLTPVEGVITQGFDPSQKHYGVDFAAREGTPVHAAAQGYVVFAGWTYDGGNMVILSHGGGYITMYKHNSAVLRSTGSLVRRGELISLVGNTGESSRGPHLHFEVLKDGMPLDPMQVLLTAKVSM